MKTEYTEQRVQIIETVKEPTEGSQCTQ